MRLTLAPVLAAIGLMLAALPSSCAGCSEECRDTKQGSEGCPCSSDQDCTTRLGEVLLCQEGACAPADPPDAPASACEQDGDCGDGELCGLGLCSPAPSCQRIDVTTLRARVREGAVLQPVVDATLTRESCTHDVTFGAPATQFSFEQVHPTTGALTATGDCTDGDWFAGMRAGVFRCEDATVILSAEEPCFTNAAASCAGTCESIGSDLDAAAGVCR